MSSRFLFPLGGEDVNEGTVVFTSCTNFRKAVGECARIGGRPNAGTKAHDMDPK